MYSPLEIFEVKKVVSLELINGWDFSLTNVGLLFIIFMGVYYFLSALARMTITFSGVLIITNNIIQGLKEKLFGFVKSFYQENLGVTSKYFLYIYFLFLVIVFSNLFGMIPFSFTTTSQLLITFSCSLTAFIGLNFIGLRKHGLAFFGMFLPNGVPLVIAPFLVPIEFISYNARVFSLAIRLFANMMSGHALMHILGGFCFSIMIYLSFGFFAGIVLSGFIIAVSILELAIAILQAYVFTVLVCIYLHDALYLH